MNCVTISILITRTPNSSDFAAALEQLVGNIESYRVNLPRYRWNVEADRVRRASQSVSGTVGKR